MTEISQAALPPIQPPMPKGVASHPLYGAYLAHRTFCANNLIRAADWDGFCHQHEQARINGEAERHPQFQEFYDWMRATKAGGRKCLPSRDMPYGLSFPANFMYWLEGGRW